MPAKFLSQNTHGVTGRAFCGLAPRDAQLAEIRNFFEEVLPRANIRQREGLLTRESCV